VRRFFLILTFLIILPSLLFAECRGTVINPVSDICWKCVFPIRIGPATIKGSTELEDVKKGGGPVCTCPGVPLPKVGVVVSFWEPFSIVETVKDPYCFPSLGTGSAGKYGGRLMGVSEGSIPEHRDTFMQAHYYIFPVLPAIGILTDFECFYDKRFDIAYATELDPAWNDSLLSTIIAPESVLFANPVAQMSCVADSVAANAGLPLDPLFWCMGSWGGAYPLMGNMQDDYTTQVGAGLAARMLFKLSRQLMIWDTTLSVCGPTPMPVLVKSQYRIHVMKPVRDHTCHPIGRSGLIWAYGKNPPFHKKSGSDNFAWMVFRKVRCCVGP